MRIDSVRERGVVIAEFAFVAPVLFFVMFGMLDLGLVAVGNSVGSNAARDGARVGIIQYIGAQDEGSEGVEGDGSASFQAIETAVLGRLAGLVRGSPDIDVTCINVDVTPEATMACTAANVDLDRDQIQVTLRWQHLAISPFFSDNSHTEVVRMTITGRPDLTSPPPPPAGISINDVRVNEPDGTATFTVTRSHAASSFSVTWTTANDSATAGSDYTASSGTIVFTAAGATTASVTVPIIDDSDSEPDETFFVNLAGITGGDATIVDSQGVGTIDSEDPLGVLSVVFKETGAVNGVVDVIEVQFNDNIASLGDWSVVNSPTGSNIKGSPATTTSGSLLTLRLSGSAVATAASGFTVTLSNVCPVGGTCTTFNNLPVADRAGPVLTGYAVNPPTGGANGRAQQGDRIVLTFSENLAYTGAATVGVQFSDPQTGGPSTPDRMFLPNLMSAATPASGNTNGYVTTNGATVTFDASTVQASGNQLTYTLGSCGACSGIGTQATNHGFAISVVTSTIRDLASPANVATGTVTFTNGRFA